MIFHVDSNVDATLAVKIANRADAAAHAVAQQIRKDTAPFVPFRTESLDIRTRVEGDTIIYPGPYARFLYYGMVMVDPNTGSPYAPLGQTKVVTDRPLVFTQDFHRQAQSHWFEASKAMNLQRWVQVAQKAVDRYGAGSNSG